MDKLTQSNSSPEHQWDKSRLRMPEPDRVSFHTAREIAILAADALNCDIAICLGLPEARQSFQNLPLADAQLEKREVIEVVTKNDADSGLFFDPALSYTSSDKEIIESFLSRWEQADEKSKMAAMTDLSRIVKYIPFDSESESPYIVVFNQAADCILHGDNAGLANHASAVFVSCPEAAKLFAVPFRTFLEEKAHPNYNWMLENALSIALGHHSLT